MVREQRVEELERWMSDVLHSGIPQFKCFVEMFKFDHAAVQTTLTLP